MIKIRFTNELHSENMVGELAEARKGPPVSKDYVKFVSSLVLFGSNGVVAAQIIAPSYEIVFARTLVGGALLFFLCLLSGRRFAFLCRAREAAWVVLSGLAMGASWIFLYEAYRLVGVGISSLAYYCAPVMVMALSPFLFGEKLTARKLVGFAAVFAGALLMSVQTLEGGGSTAGMLCGWASAVMHALMVVASKKADAVDGMENSAVQLVASFALVAAYVLLFGKPLEEIPLDQWTWVLILGVVNTALGCYLYFSSYGGLSVQSVAVLGYLEPLSAVAFSALLLGEAMTGLQVLGAALILGGALFGEWRR